MQRAYSAAISNAERLHGNMRPENQKIKLIRAQGECLGTKSRRRTWLTAKSHGEL